MRAALGVPTRKRWEFFPLSHSLSTSCILLLFWLLLWMHKRSHTSDLLQRNLRPMERTVVDDSFCQSRILRSRALLCCILALSRLVVAKPDTPWSYIHVLRTWYSITMYSITMFEKRIQGHWQPRDRLWRHIPFPCPVLSRSFSRFRYIFLLVSLLRMWAYTCTSSSKHFSLRSLFSSLFSPFPFASWLV